ncbi:hypothetical protein D3C84_1223830 [compost metagenome]
MAELDQYFRRRFHFALTPQPLEIRVRSLHFADKPVVPFILDILPVIGSKNGQKAARKMLPVDRQALQLFSRKK